MKSDWERVRRMFCRVTGGRTLTVHSRVHFTHVKFVVATYVSRDVVSQKNEPKFVLARAYEAGGVPSAQSHSRRSQASTPKCLAGQLTDTNESRCPHGNTPSRAAVASLWHACCSGAVCIIGSSKRCVIPDLGTEAQHKAAAGDSPWQGHP